MFPLQGQSGWIHGIRGFGKRIRKGSKKDEGGSLSAYAVEREADHNAKADDEDPDSDDYEPIYEEVGSVI